MLKHICVDNSLPCQENPFPTERNHLTQRTHSHHFWWPTIISVQRTNNSFIVPWNDAGLDSYAVCSYRFTRVCAWCWTHFITGNPSNRWLKLRYLVDPVDCSIKQENNNFSCYGWWGSMAGIREAAVQTELWMHLGTPTGLRPTTKFSASTIKDRDVCARSYPNLSTSKMMCFPLKCWFLWSPWDEMLNP